MPTVTYNVDYTGILPANKIIAEQHAATQLNGRNYYLIVPSYAPFFTNNLVVTLTNNGVTTPMTEGIDYYCVLPFSGATRAIGKGVYGAITINNTAINGIIAITYQTLGGTWNLDSTYVLTQIATKAYNPRTVSWEQIVGTPAIFPPIPHSWDLVDMVGETELVNKLGDIQTAIASVAGNNLTLHTTNMANPHNVSATQVGLGNVTNMTVASSADTLAVLALPANSTESSITTQKYLDLKAILKLKDYIAVNGGGGGSGSSGYGLFTTVQALETAHPAAASAGNTAYVGLGAPYVYYVSNGVQWVSAGPVTLIQGGLPMVLPSSGTINANGALVLTTPLQRVYSTGCYMYFPSGRVQAGSATGWYYVIMSSVAAGVIYNNLYVSGTPVTPFTPIAVVSAAMGAYTQTINTIIQVVPFTIPANMMGLNGQLEHYALSTQSGTGYSKDIFLIFGNSVAQDFSTANVLTASAGARIQNQGSATRQICINGTNDYGTAVSSPNVLTKDTTLAQPAYIGVQITGVNEYITIESFHERVYPN